MNKKINRIIGVLLLLFLVVSCSVVSAPDTEPEEVPRQTVKIPFVPVLGIAPLFVADEAGYFDEQNIDIEWVTIASVAEAIPLLVDGGLDVAAGTPAAGLFNGIARGMNLKVVAGLSRMGGPDDCSFITFEVRKDLYESGEVTSVADWAGHKVGINGIGAMPHFQLATLLEKEGLTMEDIELVTLPFPELVAGLQSEALDVIFTLEPLLSQVRANDLGVTQVYLNDSFPYQTSVFLMYGPNLLDKDPDLGERFMVAFLKGVRTTLEGKTENNIKYIETQTKFPPEVLQAACWDHRSPNAAINLENMMEAQEWFLKAGLQDDRITEDQIFDSRFIDNAVEILGEVED